jgi:hypothetical protein
MTRLAAYAAAALLAALAALSGVPSAAAQDSRPSPDRIARNLAENVLGEGTVRSVRVESGGRQIVISWDAVLYRTTHTRAKNREQLRGEAELATGAIIGVLKPKVIRLTIWLGTRAIAQGTRSADGLAMTYAKDLDG